MKETGFHINVRGLVQGVGYRYYCVEAARLFGLAGYVQNLDNGDVEIEVFGPPEKINGFIDEVTRTDRYFSVSEIIKDEIPLKKEYKGFTIRHY